MLPAPIRPVVECFVPGLRNVEATKAAKKNVLPKRKIVDDSSLSANTATSDAAKEATAGSEEASRQRKIVDDVKCGMCGHVVEDLWACVLSSTSSVEVTLIIVDLCRILFDCHGPCAACRYNKPSKVVWLLVVAGRHVWA